MATSAAAAVQAGAQSPTAPSLSLPTAIVGAPSLHVPAMLGGRGGLAQQSFTYCFLVEAQGHVTDVAVASALAEASRLCICIKLIGSFPRARRVL